MDFVVSTNTVGFWAVLWVDLIKPHWFLSITVAFLKPHETKWFHNEILEDSSEQLILYFKTIFTIIKKHRKIFSSDHLKRHSKISHTNIPQMNNCLLMTKQQDKKAAGKQFVNWNHFHNWFSRVQFKNLFHKK